MINILVVDDSVMDQKIAAGLLRRQPDWNIEFASNGQQALDRIQNLDRPALEAVVTDLQMPVLDGLGLVSAVQKTHPLLPVVLMTARGSETTAVQALQQGAASYVSKSNLASLLVPTVRQVLSLAVEKRSKRGLFKHMTSMECQFVLSNDSAEVTSLVSYLQKILRDMDVLAEHERLRTGVALEEALLNAAYHGNLEVSSTLREIDHTQFYELAKQRSKESPYKDRRIFVDLKVSKAGLEFVIRDEGPGFDPSSLPDPRDPANLERPCGRGLLLMRTFMDEVAYNCNGNEVRMCKCTSRKVTAH